LLSRRNFLRYGGALAGASVLVYSGADEAFEQWHTAHVKSDASDAVARPMNFLGKRFWFGYWGAFALLDGLVGSHQVTRFGRACFEAMVAGLPTLWTTQRVLGASRPNENRGPGFHPFADANAASGHAFIWGIPCFVAWRMFARRSAKLTAAALAPWVGWSRLNDRKHYLSQVLLGYGIAWAAVEAVLPEQPPETTTSATADS
jgi:membrane-associated phospholipid phosphatase